MQRSNILVVVVDGLRASALGAYGNTSIQTPALDRFAAESLLLDCCYAPSAALPDTYRALWQSLHPARPASESRRSLPIILKEAGYQTTVVTDDECLMAIQAAEYFDECVQVEASESDSSTPRRAVDAMQTELAQLFATLGEVVSHPQASPQFVWAHARGMYGAWDAPLEMQESLLDEDDPPPVRSAQLPDLTLRPDVDLEEPFRYGCAYGAQVMVLDECWQNLMDLVGEAQEPWLIMLLGARGFPLGEHDRIGGIDDRLFAEQLHVPWLIRFPDGRGRLARSSALTSPLDLKPTLTDWAEIMSRVEEGDCDGSSLSPLIASAGERGRDQLLSTSESKNLALRTSEWCLRTGAPSEEGDAEPELFVRPDDRWEANDVAKLCPDVVEELTAKSADLLRGFATGEC